MNLPSFKTMEVEQRGARLTIRVMPATEAQAHGLITKARAHVRTHVLDAEVDLIADKLANGAPLAIRWTKRAINASLQSLAKLQFDLSLAYEGVALLSQDRAAATNTFLPKRRPEFDGSSVTRRLSRRPASVARECPGYSPSSARAPFPPS
jgi:enoyl-CoA hydratase/carnithine racemase